MRYKSLGLAVVALAGAFGALTARDRLPGRVADEPADRPVDREGIVKSSRDFTAAFDRGDAKAIAAMWTDNGEMQDEGGAIIRGRKAIEEAYTQLFRDRPKATIRVQIISIRFTSPNSAIEEGILQQFGRGGELPSSSEYTAIHVREDGQWKLSFSREGGGGIDRLEDLDWLLGTWTGKAGDFGMTTTYARAKGSPFITEDFSTSLGGSIIYAGTFKIGFDRQRGQLHSWHFDNDGGYGEALWFRDGHRWVMDSIGVNGDGSETASVNILLRNNDREIVWQSIDRVVGRDPLPNTTPIRLTRTTETKQEAPK